MKTSEGQTGNVTLPAPHPRDLNEVQKAEIRGQLERVLRSPAFRGSKRSQDFLQYVVEHSLGGETEHLKGRNIGVDVFGRDPAYDPNVDAIVRVGASDLRKRLAQYYVETEHAEELRIEIPLGSYLPEFHHVRPIEASLVQESLSEARRLRRWWPAVLVVVVLAGATLAGMRWFGSSTPALDRFWAPVMESPRPVLVCSGHPVVYFLSRRVHDAYRQRKGIDPAEGPYVIELDPAEKVEGRDIVPVRGQYVGIGDAMTANMLQSLFTSKRKPAQVRFGHDISFSDLRNAPAVLIGAYSNRWTLQMTNQLRFVFVVKEGVKGVEDRLGNGHQWLLPGIAPDGRTSEDYAIVSRIFDSQSGELVISAAGITQYGTRAAGEFLTTESGIAAATRSAPSDWRSRNMQVVLRTQVVGETAGPPEVIAAHFW